MYQVRAAVLGAAIAASAAFGDGIVIESPFWVAQEQVRGGGVGLELDPVLYAQLKPHQELTIRGFALGADLDVDLDLHRVESLAPDAQILVDGQPAGRPDTVLLAGTVIDAKESTVFLGLSPLGCHGLLEIDGQTWVMSSGPHWGEGMTVVYNLSTLPDGVIEWAPFVCHAGELAQNLDLPDGAGGGLRDEACSLVDIALETDYEFTANLFGGDTDAATAYAEMLMGAATEIYDRDVRSRFNICYLSLWTTSDDPWNGTDTIDQLLQFQDYWEVNRRDVVRHVAHYLSGRPLGGGVAWLPGLCNGPYAYSLAANLGGYFPYPLVDNDPQNWDIFVVTHELGHNFGAPHTHDMTPKIDNCAGGDCSVAPNGTIMSYCHLCSGGMTNIVLHFHPRIIDERIVPYLQNVPCDILIEGVTILMPPLDQEACPGDDVQFTVQASGGPGLTYQWRFEGEPIAGATHSTLDIPNVQLAYFGTYDVVVSNVCDTDISTAATLSLGDDCCTADFNGDGVVNSQDFIAFLNAFVAGDPSADFNGDGVINSQDFIAFLNAFVDGC